MNGNKKCRKGLTIAVMNNDEHYKVTLSRKRRLYRKLEMLGTGKVERSGKTSEKTTICLYWNYRELIN